MQRVSFRVPAIAALIAFAPAAGLRAADASAELKVGLGIDQMEVKDAAETFSVAPGTRIYAWTRVTGAEGASVTVAFQKDGKVVFKQDLTVPHSPYRTNAYRTFRAGDGGDWTVQVLDQGGKELASAAVKVEVK